MLSVTHWYGIGIGVVAQPLKGIFTASFLCLWYDHKQPVSHISMDVMVCIFIFACLLVWVAF